jgi:hypothetical protein
MESNGKITGHPSPGEDPKTESDHSAQDSSPTKENTKKTQILDACRLKETEILRTLAVSEGGLITDDLRRQACKNSNPGIQNGRLTVILRATATRMFAR